MDECKVAESGKHEPNFETLKYETHIGALEARFETTCLHCDTRCETVIHTADFEWID